MIKSVLTLFLAAGLATPAYAATVVQAKGKTAIVELDDSEFESIQPTVGARVRITSNDVKTLAAIRKIAKKRILVITGASLEGQSSVQVTNAAGAAGSSGSGNRSSSRGSNFGKKLLYGINLKYVNGTGSITIGNTATTPYSGFGGSAVVLYSLGSSLAVGGEGEIAMAKGNGSQVGSITQMQMSAIGEYRFNAFSAGVSVTPFSNFKFKDGEGNDNSLNGMGFGIYGTYSVNPNIRVLFDYKMLSYKLDPATVKANDFRIGAGYYF